MSEFPLPGFEEIKKEITRLGPFRDIKANTEIKVCILTDLQTNDLYEIGTLEEWRTKYYPNLTPEQLAQNNGAWEKATRQNYEHTKNINASTKAKVFSVAEKAIIEEQVVKLWGNFTSLKFDFVNNPTDADIRIGIYGTKVPSTSAVEVSINFVPGDGGIGYVGPTKPNDVFLEGFNAQQNMSARNINDLAHEFGHALGLSHPARGLQPDGTIDGNLLPEYDTLQWALMSYKNSSGGRLQCTTPMVLEGVMNSGLIISDASL